MKRYDYRCEELARAFLPHGPEAQVVKLAQIIQDAIEETLEIAEQEKR